MDRRRLLIAGLLAGVLIAAGCLGSPGAESDLRVTDIDGDWTGDGTLELQAAVTNLGDAEGTGTVVLEAAIRDGDVYTERREVTVAPDSSERVVVAFEPTADEVGSGFDANAWME